MWLNCKVIKKRATLTFYINLPLFQGYLPFLAKFLVSPKWINFWKILPSPFPSPPLTRPEEGGGVQLCYCLFRYRNNDCNFALCESFFPNIIFLWNRRLHAIFFVVIVCLKEYQNHSVIGFKRKSKHNLHLCFKILMKYLKRNFHFHKKMIHEKICRSNA